ncbi:M23 family metallopeptidase [Cellulosimicrobium sp. TH-20]|uniref:peptidoglycan DD-metalloendopeptidase family protein n=1 Tax=Cellulosimicrobium sp. TH-20 TaxID=1980001 RepID=UPI0015842569
MTRPVELALPFHGTWLVRNSPARRVPSHGTDLFATTYAIDFVAVRGRRTAVVRDWRAALGTEPPERFVAFGQPVLAPAAGTVVAVHDGEPDHEARRSPAALLGYALTQAARARGGAAALAGNHVVLALDRPGTFVVLAHLRAGSVAVEPGRRVVVGDELGRCGSSGNSTQPHVHVQAMDAADALVARGLPLVFRGFRERARDGSARVVDRGVPAEGAVVEPA